MGKAQEKETRLRAVSLFLENPWGRTQNNQAQSVTVSVSYVTLAVTLARLLVFRKRETARNVERNRQTERSKCGLGRAERAKSGLGKKKSSLKHARLTSRAETLCALAGIFRSSPQLGTLVTGYGITCIPSSGITAHMNAFGFP